MVALFRHYHTYLIFRLAVFFGKSPGVSLHFRYHVSLPTEHGTSVQNSFAENFDGYSLIGFKMKVWGDNWNQPKTLAYFSTIYDGNALMEV